MEVLPSAVIEIMKSSYRLIKHQIDHLVHYKNNVENLKDELGKLRPMRDHMQQLMDQARRRGDILSPAVQDWIRRFNDIEMCATNLDNEVEENKKCFKGCCPDCNSRYRLSKEVIKNICAIHELHRDVNFGIVSLTPPPPSVESMPYGDFEAFESTKLAMTEIIEALKDEKICIIGVYGMGGVGKTTLIKEVGKQMKVDKVYDLVVMVTVSQNPNIKNIQGEIAEKLGMVLGEESPSQRAIRLFTRLKQETKILIILDDLWGRLELHEVGIPYADDHNGCKIVLTTRSEDVCRGMECQWTVKVRVLSEHDSWTLFNRKAGVDSPMLWDIARKVAQECRGLPLAIVTLGRALRNKEPLYWMDALQQLKKSIQPTFSGVHAKVFSSLTLSYESLESQELKLCFLFCCLFPEDNNINESLLMIYGMCEGFVRDVDSLEEARGRVHFLVDKLKSCCLLLDGNEENKYSKFLFKSEDENEDKFVKMHDVIRDVAIAIASKGGQGFLVKAGQNLKNLKKEHLGEYRRISLMNCGITSIDDDWPESPHLLTLLLQNNLALVRISDSLFTKMKSLVVLDLSTTSISSLPPSFPCLLNLRSLCLDECFMLRDISLVGGLKRLEILRLRRSGICELTKEMGQLTNLMLLDLRDTRHLKRVSPNVISMFCRLEELYMRNSFNEWEFEGTSNESKASLTEVGSLSCLKFLQVDVKSEEYLARDISGPWTNLNHFHISIGQSGSCGDWRQLKRAMLVVGITKPISGWGQVLLEKTENLSLVRCNIEGVDNFRKFFQPRGLGEVRFLNVSQCMKLTSIFPPDALQMLCNLERVEVKFCRKVQVVFQCEGMANQQPLLCRLREVKLFNLINLKGIWEGPFPHGSIHNLKTLSVMGCKGLRILLSFPIAQSLKKLENLVLVDCDKIEKLISDQNEELTQVAEATSSRFLLLVERNSSEFSSCTTFQSLRVLILRCNNALNSLFPLSLAQGLLHLEQLEIKRCFEMEEIISTKQGDVVDDGIFPQLKVLKLETVPKLTRFYGGEVLLNWIHWKASWFLIVLI